MKTNPNKEEIKRRYDELKNAKILDFTIPLGDNHDTRHVIVDIKRRYINE